MYIYTIKLNNMRNLISVSNQTVRVGNFIISNVAEYVLDNGNNQIEFKLVSATDNLDMVVLKSLGIKKVEFNAMNNNHIDKFIEGSKQVYFTNDFFNSLIKLTV